MNIIRSLKEHITGTSGLSGLSGKRAEKTEQKTDLHEKPYEIDIQDSAQIQHTKATEIKAPQTQKATETEAPKTKTQETETPKIKYPDLFDKHYTKTIEGNFDSELSKLKPGQTFTAPKPKEHEVVEFKTGTVLEYSPEDKKIMVFNKSNDTLTMIEEFEGGMKYEDKKGIKSLVIDSKDVIESIAQFEEQGNKAAVALTLKGRTEYHMDRGAMEYSRMASGNGEHELARSILEHSDDYTINDMAAIDLETNKVSVHRVKTYDHPGPSNSNTIEPHNDAKQPELNKDGRLLSITFPAGRTYYRLPLATTAFINGPFAAALTQSLNAANDIKPETEKKMPGEAGNAQT